MSLRSDGRTTLYDGDRPAADLRSDLRSGAVPVAVHGLGKMGLPLAAVYADLTGNVTGVDVDPDVAAAIERGDCPVDREPGLADLVSRTVESGALEATTDGRAAAEAARLHVLIVPTTLQDQEPDLSNLQAAVRTVGAGLDPGDLVVVECTVPPGTCERVVEPVLAAESGLDAGEFGVAFCPERTSSGRALRDIRGSYPKVVGGTDAAATDAAALVYDEVTDNEVVTVDARTAECVKLFEGVYRDVNIALANELGTLADDLGVDVRRAFEVANDLPMCDLHDPGAGVGGHCIPYYPHFLLSAVSGEAPLVGTAREVNDAMPTFLVRKLREQLATFGKRVEDATVVVLGLTYRAGVAETRKSPARPIAGRLSDLGATVYGVDPMLDGTDGFDARPATVEELPDLDPDAAVLVTAHAEFDAIDWRAFDPMAVVDGRAALDLDDGPHRVHTVGDGRR